MALIALLVVAGPVAGLASSAGADDTHTYEIEMYNAFGLVPGSQVRIAGVNAGEVTDLDINEAKRAVVTVDLSGDLGTLGTETKCTSEPQSLIAEYFISCEPAGPPITEDDDADAPDADIPASQVSQTVQNDLVQNTLRESYRERLTLLINEFGTALAGNPESLNEAIKLGAPSLTQLRRVTRILADQNTIIRDLNANSDEVIGQLAARRADVVRFIREARDTAKASAARGESLSRDFEILDDFLAELRPTLVDLDHLAVEQTPLLTDLRAAAPGLTQLADNLPPFEGATRASLDGFGQAATVGERALRRGRDEIEQLADAGRQAPVTAEMLADFLRDVDDPRRAVEIDDRVAKDTGRTDPRAGQRDTKGYTGLEGLLNYVYYQTGALNQYDQLGHLLHFSLYDVFTGPCGAFSSGHDPETGAPGVPAQGGGTTTSILDAADCVAWLGPNQPGINEDLGLPMYDPSVCPNGTAPAVAERELCDPGGARTAPRRADRDRPGRGNGSPAESGESPGSGSTGAEAAPGPQPGGGGPAPPASEGGGDGDGGQGPSTPLDDIPDDLLDQILDLPPDAIDDLPPELQQQLDEIAPAPSGDSAATQDLLDFLFSD